MDTKLCLPEEQRGERNHRDGGIPEVVVRKYRDEDLVDLCCLYCEFWMLVNRQDLSEWIEVDINGKKFRLPKCEAILHWYMAAKHDVVVAEAGGKLVGFLLYQIPFDCMMVVRGWFIRPEHRGRRLIKDFFKAVGKPLTRIVFQTVKDNPPGRMLELSAGRRVLIGEDEKFLTWEMEWED